MNYRSPGGFSLQCFGSANPTDGQVLYFTNAGVAVDAVLGVHAPRAAIMKKAFLTISVAGTLGTDEDATAAVRIGSTDNVISTAVEFDALRQTYSKTDFNVAVAEGDLIVLKVTHPTFSTNPTSVVYNLVIWFE